MNKELFGSKMKLASKKAIEFGSKFITNNLSDKVRYDVHFNQSFDDGIDGFDLYKGDDNKVVLNLDFETALHNIYRNGKIPVWINISICKSNRKSTILRLECAGRFTDNFSDLYYSESEVSPFGIKSPQLLPWISKDEKCYLLYDAKGLESHLNKVRWNYYRYMNRIKNKIRPT